MIYTHMIQIIVIGEKLSILYSKVFDLVTKRAILQILCKPRSSYFECVRCRIVLTPYLGKENSSSLAVLPPPLTLPPTLSPSLFRIFLQPLVCYCTTCFFFFWPIVYQFMLSNSDHYAVFNLSTTNCRIANVSTGKDIPPSRLE
jgi:hypothetical protein